MSEMIDLEKLYRQEKRRWLREEAPRLSFRDVLTVFTQHLNLALVRSVGSVVSKLQHQREARVHRRGIGAIPPSLS